MIRGEEMILDQLRRRYVKLTPEEWVRQNFIRYLNDKGQYPLGLMGVEMEYGPKNMKRRTDILVHDRLGKPVMIVECKASEVELKVKVFDQIADYNRKFKVPYLVVTNGMQHFACKFRNDFKDRDYLLELPLYEDLITGNVLFQE